MHHHIKEFSKHAHTYDNHTPIQQEVARYLVSHLAFKPKTILDLGCGSGAIYRSIDWEIDTFMGVDNSTLMLEQHPKSSQVFLINADFDETLSWSQLSTYYDVILSSSALQWSKNIEMIVSKMAHISPNIALAIFTDKTFETLYSLSGLHTFLPDKTALINLCQKDFICQYEVKKFELYFEDNLSLFRYIKKSGVSGGEKKLTIQQLKSLIKNYPNPYLEFEVLFIWGQSKHFIG